MCARSRDREVVSKCCAAGWGGCGQISSTLEDFAATAGARVTEHTEVTKGR